MLLFFCVFQVLIFKYVLEYIASTWINKYFVTNLIINQSSRKVGKNQFSFFTNFEIFELEVWEFSSIYD